MNGKNDQDGTTVTVSFVIRGLVPFAAAFATFYLLRVGLLLTLVFLVILGTVAALWWELVGFLA